MDQDKTNGSKNSDQENKGEVLRFPSLAQRDKIRREKIEKEKQWQKDYQKRQSSGENIPFFNKEKIPPFSFTLVGAFIAIHILLAMILPASLKVQAYLTLGFIPANFSGGFEQFQLSSLLSPFAYMFLHGGFTHLLFNAVMGLALGTFIERQIGGWGALKFFIICGLISALVFFAFSPFSGSPMVGASGGISGFFGAFLRVMPMRQNHIPALSTGSPWKFVFIWAGLMIVIGLLSGAHTAWQAHIGGLFAGAIIMDLMQKGKLKL